FEETYLADQALLDEIELVERLGAGLKEHGASAAAPTRAQTWLRALASPQLAAAASVLLVVSLGISGVLYRENSSLRQSQGGIASGVVRMLPVESLRGASAVDVEAPAPDEIAVLLVDPGVGQHDVYSVVVSRREDRGATVIWAADGLVAQFQDQIAIGMSGRLLTPGEYEIVVEGRANDWPSSRASEAVQRLHVRIVPKAAQR
ncbi:MAG TPA: hypothetical protein VL131_16830, partial [Gammaproteobacteria bacterium]|nr:hypothetical protein [Gammaproteobacteria bacterium]